MVKVSQAAEALLAGSPALSEAHLRAEACPYHPDFCPNGFLNLATAENRPAWDLLAERLEARPPLAERDTRPVPPHGSAELRHRLSGLLSRLTGTPLEAEQLVVVAGAAAALDAIASAICDPGEVIVVPSPSSGAFGTALAGRSRAELLPARTDTGESLPQAVERVLARAGGRARAVALSSPCDPTGEVHSAETLDELLAVAEAHDVEVLADESGAGSAFGPTSFTSLAGRPRVHQVWGFAEDFGLPGLQVAVVHTADPELAAAVRALARFSPVPSDTQALLSWLLSDVLWTEAFLAENRRRLAASYTAAAGLLDAHGIPYTPAGAGLSIWADLEAWLPTGDWGGERVLWQRLFERARIALAPGEVFHTARPGRFRLCHSLDPALVKEALTRLAEHLGEPHDPLHVP